MFKQDRDNMQAAIQQALRARAAGQAPFGCVIVDHTTQWMLGIAGGSETPVNPIRHSELLAIRAACQEVQGTLEGCTLYSTHQPCCMCAGAIAHAKLSRVVYGSTRADLPRLFRQKPTICEVILSETTHPPEVIGGVLRDDCIALWDPIVAAIDTQ